MVGLVGTRIFLSYFAYQIIRLTWSCNGGLSMMPATGTGFVTPNINIPTMARQARTTQRLRMLRGNRKETIATRMMQTMEVMEVESNCRDFGHLSAES